MRMNMDHMDKIAMDAITRAANTHISFPPIFHFGEKNLFKMAAIDLTKIPPKLISWLNVTQLG